jgi:NTE family protein
MRPSRVPRVVACAALLVGCTSAIQNEPINRPLAVTAKEAIALASEAEPVYEDLTIALAFSGGGTRAAAFSYGVLSAFHDTTIRTRTGPVPLSERIDFVSGVSGGSVLAAYYGLKKQAALNDFKQRFLLRNAEEALHTDLSLGNIARGLQGGINDSTQFPRWLDANLYNGATFKDLPTSSRPRVWINASDIYNRTPFVFGSATFGALCSDLETYPVSLAVAASAAVPVLFAPVVVQNYQNHSGACPVPSPEFIARMRSDDTAPPLMKAYADALDRYRSGDIRYVKLLDGGLVDNYGLAALTIARLGSRTPHGPLSPQEAVKLRRLLFMVVDAGRAPSGEWAQTVAGPAGVDLIMATSDTATGAGALQSYSTFDGIMDDWHTALVKWRCGLSEADRRKYRAPPGWSCRDVRFFVGRIAFEQLGPERARQLNAVETRFKLPPEQVDLLIHAGRDALRTNSTMQSFLKSLGPGNVMMPVVAASERWGIGAGGRGDSVAGAGLEAFAGQPAYMPVGPLTGQGSTLRP